MEQSEWALLEEGKPTNNGSRFGSGENSAEMVLYLGQENRMTPKTHSWG